MDEVEFFNIIVHYGKMRSSSLWNNLPEEDKALYLNQLSSVYPGEPKKAELIKKVLTE